MSKLYDYDYDPNTNLSFEDNILYHEFPDELDEYYQKYGEIETYDNTWNSEFNEISLDSQVPIYKEQKKLNNNNNPPQVLIHKNTKSKKKFWNKYYKIIIIIVSIIFLLLFLKFKNYF